MNLIAKEYIAAHPDNKGVLILSEMAGASKELGEALIINPNHIESIADAIKKALEMSDDEKIHRNLVMQRRLKTYDVFQWADNTLNTLMYIKNKQTTYSNKLLDKNAEELLIKDFQKAKNKIIFLDYDGTLMPFADTPQLAFPDSSLLELLAGITKLKGVHLVLVSGRDKETLEEWFRGIDVSFVAEHGVLIKEKNKDWRTAKKIDNIWKVQIKPILVKYTDLLPGSFIEEKSNTLVWHYRKADRLHGEFITNYLIDNLLNLTTNMNLQIATGSKTVEIRNIDINKGTAVQDFISDNNYDFILSIGDDWTDEDMFKVLPDYAYSIKVGMIKSYSRFNVYSYNDVRKLLKSIINV